MAKYQTNYFKTDLLTNATKAQRAKAQADAAKALSKSGKTSKPTTKKMSAAMAAWVQANRGKLEKPTAKQEALFNQYDALKKEGNLPDTSKVKRRSSVAGQPSAKAKSAGVAPVQPASQVQKAAKAVKKASDKAVEGGYTISSKNRKQSSPAKPKLNPQQRRKAGQIKRRRGMSPADVAKSISDKLRLTYKKGQIVQRGGKFYKSDGKGGFTLVHSKQF
jgi:hypothetical protein|tara:strand:- start:1061 stop:1717 length:657 start_codon:yes stop_codon:yes gene_type:complete